MVRNNPAEFCIIPHIFQGQKLTEQHFIVFFFAHFTFSPAQFHEFCDFSSVSVETSCSFSSTLWSSEGHGKLGIFQAGNQPFQLKILAEELQLSWIWIFKKSFFKFLFENFSQHHNVPESFSHSKEPTLKRARREMFFFFEMDFFKQS